MGSSFRPRSSAGPLGAGVVLLVIGQMIFAAGAQQAARASMFNNDGSTTMTVGGVVLVAGMVALVVGLVNLARAVDYLARREHARSVIASTTVPEAPAPEAGVVPPRPIGLSASAQEAAARGQALIDGES